MHRRAIHGGLIAWLAVVLPAVAAAAVEPDGIGFFEQKIRPVLVQECYGCHSAGAKKVRGGLRLDTRAAVLAGGDSGPAVVPGKPDESLILEALRHEGLAMPPKSKLPDAVVADFERWITMGAPDPRDGQAVPVRSGIDLEAGRRFWSYQPPRRHTPPPGGRRRLAADRHRPLPARRAGGTESAAGGRRRSRHAGAAARLRPGRHAPDARGDRRLRGRSGPGRLRAAGRSPARLALGSASAGAGTGSTSSALASR